MSDTGYDFEDYDTDNSAGGLRKQLEKALAQAKKERELREAAEAKAVSLEKKSSLSQVLREKKVDPAIARFLEADNVEATPEAVDAWLKANPFFNAKATEQADEQVTEQEQQESPAEPNSSIPPDVQQALLQSQQLDASGVSPNEVGVLQRIQSISTDPKKVSWEQLLEDVKASGVPLG